MPKKTQPRRAFHLVLPDDLMVQLRKIADTENRSLSRQVEVFVRAGMRVKANMAAD